MKHELVVSDLSSAGGRGGGERDLGTSRISLRWPNYLINSVDETKKY